MTARAFGVIASVAVATLVCVATAAGEAAAAVTAGAGIAAAPPVGERAACDTSGLMGTFPREFTAPSNMTIGPLTMHSPGSGQTARSDDESDSLPSLWVSYPTQTGANKVWVFVRAGHRVTLEIAPSITRGAGLGFSSRFGRGQRLLRVRGVNAAAVVTFTACTRNLTRWIGLIGADTPRCIPLRVWIDSEPRPQHAVIRFGVTGLSDSLCK